MQTIEQIIKDLNSNSTSKLEIDTYTFYSKSPEEFQGVTNALLANTSLDTLIIKSPGSFIYDLKSLGNVVSKKGNITEFVYLGNNVVGLEGFEFVELLKSNKNLKTLTLDLSGQMIGGTHGFDALILYSILTNPSLRSLTLTVFNSSSRVGDVFHCLKNNHTLKSLTLNTSAGCLTYEHINILEYLPKALTENKTLRFIKFRVGQLGLGTGDIIPNLFRALEQNKSLVDIEISFPFDTVSNLRIKALVDQKHSQRVVSDTTELKSDDEKKNCDESEKLPECPTCHKPYKPENHEGSKTAKTPKLDTLPQFQNSKCYSSAVYTPEEHNAIIEASKNSKNPDNELDSQERIAEAPGGPTH